MTTPGSHAGLMRAIMGYLVQPPPWVHDPSRRQNDRYFQWEPVTERVDVALGEGCVSLLVRGDGGSVLLDAKAPGFGELLRRESESFGPPIEAVVACGCGPDQAGGSPAFRGDARIIAHERAAARLAQDAPDHEMALNAIRERIANNESHYPDDVREQIDAAAPPTSEALAPTETVAGDANLEIGGVRVRLIDAPNAHADGDMAVFLPDDNVLFMGDLLFSGMHPVIDGDRGGSTIGWQRALRRCIDLCDGETVVVAGHGIATLLGQYALREQYNYFNWLRRMAQEGAQAGFDKETVMEQVPPPEPYPWSRLYKYAVGVAFDEIASSA